MGQVKVISGQAVVRQGLGGPPPVPERQVVVVSHAGNRQVDAVVALHIVGLGCQDGKHVVADGVIDNLAQVFLVIVGLLAGPPGLHADQRQGGLEQAQLAGQGGLGGIAGLGIGIESGQDGGNIEAAAHGLALAAPRAGEIVDDRLQIAVSVTQDILAGMVEGCQEK